MPDFDQNIDDLIEFLPVATAERIAPILTDDDILTLKFLFVESIPENTLRALASDLGYLERWHLIATGHHLEWPAPEDAVLKFIAHHLFDLDEKERNPNHGMPDAVSDQLIEEGACQTPLPHAPSTVQRRLSHWKRLHVVKGLDHVFDLDHVQLAKKSAIKASKRLKTKKSKLPITLDVLNPVLKTCDTVLPAGRRDRAMLLIAFGSGGRRRSEMTSLRIEDIEPPVPLLVKGEERPVPVETYEIRLRQAKRISAQDDERIYVSGRPARALEEWIWRLRLDFGPDVAGPIFRRIRRHSIITEKAISPAMVNTILKERLERAGYNPQDYSAHGIRSGYLTEARNQGIPLEEAMAQTKHRSFQVASGYYQQEDKKRSRAIKVAG